MIRFTSLSAALALLLVSCGKSEKGSSASLDEVIRAVGATRFEVKLPAHCKPTDMVGLALRYADGTMRRGSSSSGYQPGQVVAVYYFSPLEGRPSYSLVTEQSVSRGSFELDPFKATSMGVKKKDYQMEECLVRFSRDNSISPPPQKGGEDDFDLILTIDPKP